DNTRIEGYHTDVGQCPRQMAYIHQAKKLGGTISGLATIHPRRKLALRARDICKYYGILPCRASDTHEAECVGIVHFTGREDYATSWTQRPLQSFYHQEMRKEVDRKRQLMTVCRARITANNLNSSIQSQYIDSI